MQLVGEYEPSTWPDARDQVEQYERTDGVEGGTLFGYPVVILTTLGKQSGKLRKTPVMKVEHQGSYAVLASMGGAPVHPAWFHNLVAHPRAALQDGPIKREYNSRVLGGNERSSWWARAVVGPAAATRRPADRRRGGPRRCPRAGAARGPGAGLARAVVAGLPPPSTLATMTA